VPTCLSCTEDEKKIIYCWLIHSFFEGSSQCQGLRQIAAKAHWHRSYRALGRALQSTCYSKKTTQRSSPDVKPKPMNISGIRNKRRCGALQLPHKSTFRAHVLVNVCGKEGKGSKKGPREAKYGQPKKSQGRISGHRIC